MSRGNNDISSKNIKILLKDKNEINEIIDEDN